MEELRWARKIYQEVANKCGFFRKWVDSGNGNVKEWELSLFLGDVNVYSEKNWKVLINNKVREFGLEKWKMGMENKSSLKLYSSKGKPKKEIFYNGDWGSSLLFKARSNSLEVNDRTYRFRESRDRNCMVCNMRVRETLDHLFVECPAYEQARDGVTRDFKDLLGENEFREIISSDDNGLGFFLGLVEGGHYRLSN